MKKILLILMAMFVFGLQNVNAQENALKIVTNHPDFQLKVKRCAVSGTNMIIDLIANNLGSEDIPSFEVVPKYIVVYDDEGNIYDYCGAKVANQQRYVKQWNAFDDKTPAVKIIPGVPLKISVKVEGVDKAASNIALMELGIECKAWDLYAHQEKCRVKLRNIPITRN